MKKLLKSALLLAMLAILVLSLASCDQVKDLLGKNDNSSEDPTVEKEIWNMSTVYSKAQALGYEGTLEEFVELVSGKDGTNGKDGINGKDGVGIKGSLIDKRNHLIFILTDGSTIDAGLIESANATPGVFEVTFDYGDGNMVTTYSENYRVEAPEKPTRENCDFGGWYFKETSLDGIFLLWYFDAYAVTKDMTLYARWIEYGDPNPNPNPNPPEEDEDEPLEEGWWDNINYDQETIIFQMTNSSNKQELPSGCERYLAGESNDCEAIDELVKTRNQNAYKYTKVNVKYLYYPDNNFDYYFTYARNQIINTIDTTTMDNCPDIFCNWMTDMLLVSLKGKFANVHTADNNRYGENYFNFNFDTDYATGNKAGYMSDLMRSLTLNPAQLYVIASDYFIDLIRAFYVIPVNINLFNECVGKVDPALEDLNKDGVLDIKDFYEEVYSGGWTYDRIIQYSQAIYTRAGGTNSENCNDVLGFALGKNGLPAAGMIYSSSAVVINRTVENGVTTYTYPDSNEKLGMVIQKINDMMDVDGIMCMDQTDAAILGLAGDNKTALLGIRHKFTNNSLLFGGIVTLGSLEYSEYQNLKRAGGFGIVPVPVYEEGDNYLTQIHVVGRAGAITARKTAKFSACSAFLQYQTENSSEILDHYYHYNLADMGNPAENVDMMAFIRNNVRTSFDKLFEEAIIFYFENGIEYSDSYHNQLASSCYELDNFNAVYSCYLELKRVNLKALESEYEKLPK